MDEGYNILKFEIRAKVQAKESSWQDIIIVKYIKSKCAISKTREYILIYFIPNYYLIITYICKYIIIHITHSDYKVETSTA